MFEKVVLNETIEPKRAKENCIMCSSTPDVFRVINSDCEMVGKCRRHEV